MPLFGKRDGQAAGRNGSSREAELARRVEQLNLINLVGRDATSVLDLNVLLPRVARLIREMLEYQAVLIVLVDCDSGETRLAAAAAAAETDLLEEGLRLPAGQGLIGHVARTGEALLVGDVETDPRYYRDARLPGIRSELVLPMRIGERLLGVLDLESLRVDAFNPGDARVMQTLADQIAVAINNARLFQAEAEARSAADTLREISQVVNSTLDLDEVLAQILSSLGKVLAYDSACIMMLEGDTLAVRAAQGFADPDAVRRMRFPLASWELNRAVIEGGKPLVLRDTTGDGRWRRNEVPGALSVKAWMGVPLVVAGDTVGMLTIDSFRKDAYDESNLPLISAFANQAALALRNAELFKAAQEARAEAERANGMKSSFLAKMSHELRTPLNAIINFAFLLGAGTEGELNGGQAELIGRIETAGKHLLGLINDILDLAKIEAGRMELYREDSDLVEIVEETMRTAAVLVSDKPVSLEFDPGPTRPVPVFIDRKRIRQVVLNLVSNAVKFTDEGSVVVSIRVPTGAVASGTAVATVEVADTGRGVPSADLDRIFEEFTQAENARDKEGTGLGLPISRRFVEMHGGVIRASSIPGAGSTFSFDLPLSVPPAPATVDDEPAAAADAAPAVADGVGSAGIAARRNGSRVLVIDVGESGELVSRWLAGGGYEVVVPHGVATWPSSDPADILRAVRESMPDAIVLDVAMPDADGWNALKALREDPGTRSIPVVICSVARDERRASFFDANDYVSKPLDPGAILAILARYAPRGGTVLAIDDDPDSLDIVRRILDREHIAVRTASNGADGLASIRAERPDAVVLDLMMPGMNGFEVLAALRGDPATVDIPVVVVTSKDLGATERAQLGEMAATPLQKGAFSPEDLVRIVSRAIARGKK